ncbi:hypothetical protein F511_07844 [Dorcoceras hygrometricum]|uniref:Uncharacterized protein n=1 Tax=Dorcoceras hygrometricum TaxID=472368 RepID=A0A2Z7AZW6_9LAMI|nr:hypothetical protein F511_07844 [Dorcoceras hygrometricum]
MSTTTASSIRSVADAIDSTPESPECDMHWRYNVFTLSPRTPDRAPNLAPFLEAMQGKSYNSPELTKEDLLCFFKFSGKGVEFVGDLDERMGRAELLQAMQEAGRASGEVAPPKMVTKKRKAPSTAEKEARGEKRKKASASTLGAQKEEVSRKKQAPTPPTPTSEGTADVPPVRTTAEASSSGKGPELGHPFDPSKDSLVESPSAVADTRYICNMALDRDLKVLREADNAEVIGHFSANISSVGLPSKEVPVRKWALVSSRSGLCVCVEELREIASAELDLSAQLGSSPEELSN